VEPVVAPKAKAPVTSPEKPMNDDYVKVVGKFKGQHPDEVVEFYRKGRADGIDHHTLVEAAMKAHPELTHAEAEAIYGYTTKQWYRDLNHSLAKDGGTQEAKDLAALLKSGVDKMPQGATTQFRGMRFEGEGAAERMAAFDKKFEVGSVVESDYFWSTGPDPGNAYAGGRNLKIETTSAKDISELAFGVNFHENIGKTPYSSESLIPPGVKFRVTEIDPVTGQITLKEIP
jgi:hypothetical protein